VLPIMLGAANRNRQNGRMIPVGGTRCRIPSRDFQRPVIFSMRSG
jgi:hypothetical protein